METTYKITPLKGRVKDISPAKFCERCGSVFITEKECESCGYQFWVNRLGEPLGERSFYQLREDYNASYGQLAQVSSSLRTFLESCYPSRKRQYFAKLRFRSNLLVDYFFNSDDQVVERRNLFLQELVDIYSELIKNGISIDEVWNKIDSEHLKRPNQGFYQIFSSRIFQLDKAVVNYDDSKWYSYKIFAAGLFFIFVIFTALSLYSRYI